MGTLSREDILARLADMRREELEVPQLGGKIHIRVLTLHEVKEIEKLRKASGDNNLAMYPKVLLLGCVNEDGSPLFQTQDAATFDRSMWPAVDMIVKEIFYLNNMATRPKEEVDKEEPEYPKADAALNGSR
jgi:hypothetical protein